jgi:predicted phage terminase large subunit-like protein
MRGNRLRRRNGSRHGLAVTIYTVEDVERLRRLRDVLLEKERRAHERMLATVYDSEYRRKARPEQLPPEGDWTYWVIKAGRGFGKGWAGARWLRERVLLFPGTEWFIGNKDFDDIRSISIEGPSGFLNACLPGEIAGYNPETGESAGYNKTTCRIRMSNGSIIHPISGEVPRKGRGKNLAGGWADELSSWKYETVWTEGIGPALRTELPGDHPRVVITSTPKQTPLWKRFAKRTDPAVVFTTGSTFDNAANLSAEALDEMRRTYEGTRLGRQELYGEELDDVEGALWHAAMIDPYRINHAPSDMVRVVVAVDPAVTDGPDSDETGIIVAAKGPDGHIYVLADRSGRLSPMAAAKRIVNTYEEFHADLVVAEVNNGGAFIEAALRNIAANLPYEAITAKRGKALRAQPVSMMAEQGRIHHVGDPQKFARLEEQMLGWVPDSGDDSPDRLDAMVYAVTKLAPASGGNADRTMASWLPECYVCGTRNASDDKACSGCGAQLNKSEPERIMGLNTV